MKVTNYSLVECKLCACVCDEPRRLPECFFVRRTDFVFWGYRSISTAAHVLTSVLLSTCMCASDLHILFVYSM